MSTFSRKEISSKLRESIEKANAKAIIEIDNNEPSISLKWCNVINTLSSSYQNLKS